MKSVTDPAPPAPGITSGPSVGRGAEAATALRNGTPAQVWEKALAEYRWLVDFTKFKYRYDYPGWFQKRFNRGDREETKKFEDDFRERAGESLECWYEVVFWKLYGRNRDSGTKRIIEHLKSLGYSAMNLRDACQAYIVTRSRKDFCRFQSMLVSSRAIAVAATFPAFLAPDKFPMVDVTVANWVRENLSIHNPVLPETCQLKLPKYPGNHATVLTISDFEFMKSWIDYCQCAAKRLPARTNDAGDREPWRARDVEMAVFQAERSGIRLPRLPPVDQG